MLTSKYTFSRRLIINLLSGIVAVSIPTAEVLAANFSANSFATLNTAIQSANAAAGADTVTLTGSMTFAAGNELTLIQSDIDFIGAGFTITGSNTRIFFVDSGTVSFKNMTISGGKATGGSGGGGGAGLGGAIFVNNGNVTIDGVTFTNNTATGAMVVVLVVAVVWVVMVTGEVVVLALGHRVVE